MYVNSLFPSLLSHAHCRNNACSVCISVSSFGPARPPHDDHSLVSTSIRMRSHGIFSQCACVFHHPNPHAQSRIFSQCACVFHRRMDVACVHTRTRSYGAPFVSIFQSARVSKLQSARAPKLQSARAPELQSAIRSFFTIFFNMVDENVMIGDLSVSPRGCCGRSTRGRQCFFFFFSDFADMKMKTCQGLARRHALKRPPFP